MMYIVCMKYVNFCQEEPGWLVSHGHMQSQSHCYILPVEYLDPKGVGWGLRSGSGQMRGLSELEVVPITAD